MNEQTTPASPELAICDRCAKFGRCQYGIPAIYRLPKRGETCRYTGYSRSFLEGLIYPNARNNFNPPIKVNRQLAPGAKKAAPIIPGVNFCDFLHGNSNEEKAS